MQKKNMPGKILNIMAAAGVVFASLFFVSPIPTYALIPTAIVPNLCQNTTKCGLCELALTFKNASDIMIAIAGPAAILFLFWAAVMFMTSGGSSSRVGEAKKIATAAVIGLAIVLFSWIILNTLINKVFRGSSIAPWATIDCAALKTPTIAKIPPPPPPGPTPPAPATSTCPLAFGIGTGLQGGVMVTKTYPHTILGVITAAPNPGVNQNIQATLAEYNKLKTAATAASSSFQTMTINSLYRPYLYQAHLYDLYTLNNNPTINTPACTTLNATVIGQLRTHGIRGIVGAPSRCGTSSRHVTGLGIDIGGNFTTAQYNQLDQIAQTNNIELSWNNYPGDPYHFDLTTSPPPFVGCNNTDEWY